MSVGASPRRGCRRAYHGHAGRLGHVQLVRLIPRVPPGDHHGGAEGAEVAVAGVQVHELAHARGQHLRGHGLAKVLAEAARLGARAVQKLPPVGHDAGHNLRDAAAPSAPAPRASHGTPPPRNGPEGGKAPLCGRRAPCRGAGPRCGRACWCPRPAFGRPAASRRRGARRRRTGCPTRCCGSRWAVPGASARAAGPDGARRGPALGTPTRTCCSPPPWRRTRPGRCGHRGSTS